MGSSRRQGLQKQDHNAAIKSQILIVALLKWRALMTLLPPFSWWHLVSKGVVSATALRCGWKAQTCSLPASWAPLEPKYPWRAVLCCTLLSCTYRTCLWPPRTAPVAIGDIAMPRGHMQCNKPHVREAK